MIPTSVFMASSLRRNHFVNISFGCDAAVVGDFIKSPIHNSNDERNATQQSLTREQKAGNQNCFLLLILNSRLIYVRRSILPYCFCKLFILSISVLVTETTASLAVCTR